MAARAARRVRSSRIRHEMGGSRPSTPVDGPVALRHNHALSARRQHVPEQHGQTSTAMWPPPLRSRNTHTTRHLWAAQSDRRRVTSTSQPLLIHHATVQLALLAASPPSMALQRLMAGGDAAAIVSRRTKRRSPVRTSVISTLRTRAQRDATLNGDGRARQATALVSRAATIFGRVWRPRGGFPRPILVRHSGTFAIPRPR